MGPEVGSTVQWQEGTDARAPLVASVLEQFGRMTALARETTTSLLTSTAYWGAQPGPPPQPAPTRTQPQPAPLNCMSVS